MQLAVYGAGYLATVMSSCLADFGLPVTCFHEETTKISSLAQERLGFYEKNLAEVVRRNVRCSRLLYSHDVESAMRRAKAVFIAVDEPEFVESAARHLAKYAQPEQLILICTPVPVGTARRVDEQLKNSGATVISHPVFITDGCAVEDFNWPDRILLGTSSPNAVMAMKTIYRSLVMRGVPVIVTNFETAELVREASTAFLATKISFINELAGLCEHVNADAVDMALALGLDKKISPRCLQPGAAFGGPFVESEMDSLAKLASETGQTLRVMNAAREVNRTACERIMKKIATALESTRGKHVGLLGLAFKPHTSSVASSASMLLAKELVSSGAEVRAYDPVAQEEARLHLNTVRYCDSAYSAAEGSDALIVGTGWPEFRTLDFTRIKRALKRPLIVDTKNLLDAERMRSLGFEYVGIGRA